jgi:alpha,alpha-trehalase
MFAGIKDTTYEYVIPEMVENFVYLFRNYHIIPNFSHHKSLDRSQPPFFTSMILNAYEVLQSDKRITSRITSMLRSRKRWLASRMKIAQQEYTDVWMNVEDYHHFVPELRLNRYGNRDAGYALPSELESGWDLTSRFYNRCNEFLPVDLNCYLYKYEVDFARMAKMLGETQEESRWLRVAEYRKEQMIGKFWNSSKGFFYDYDYVNNIQSGFDSLAGFVPLWAGIASPEQAKRIVDRLPLFETDYGLTITSKESLPPILDLSIFPRELQITMERILKPKQWDYPNIWPPLEYLTVQGLLIYGFVDDAKRIMTKSLNAHIHAFKKYGALLEKMDGVTGDIPPSYWYPTQLGFGWTNAIFSKYTRILAGL